MVGTKLSVVTLEPPAPALSSNYLSVELARAEPANKLLEVEIGAVTENGLREAPSRADVHPELVVYRLKTLA